MIRKRKEEDDDCLLYIWLVSSAQAHLFLDEEFVKEIATDVKNKFLPKVETWVHENEQGIIGFVSMIGNEIGGLFVLPDKQSNGVGTALVNFVQNIYQTLSVEVFEKNEIGKSDYKKYGFVE